MIHADLIGRAMQLRARAPQEWQDFVHELRVLADKHKDDILCASLEQLSNAQGRAQSANLLVKDLENVDKLDQQRRIRSN